MDVSDLRENICQQLQHQMWRRMREGVTAEQIGARIGKPDTYVWAALGGLRKLNVRSLSDLAYAMDLRMSVEITPSPSSGGPQEPPLPVEGG